ncbi:MAG: reverse transcriptase domain-containing protein [Sedimenticola sp.]
MVDWENLWLAFRKAAKGKRGKSSTAGFEATLADQLLGLQEELRSGRYRPGGYVNFHIHEPKRRQISAAPFRDRVVHHAVCNIIEPLFERAFISDSYANRPGKGTHKAIDRFQQFAKRYHYVLRGDIVQHFASIDHEILLQRLTRRIDDPLLIQLIERIINSGQGVLEREYTMHWFPGDDLLAVCRPRGLPIGNLTSQFWSHCYLDPFDHFVKRELGCRAYLRYVDDSALFSNDKEELQAWREAIIQRLARFRLTLHESAFQISPTHCGAPWLGFVIYPDHRKLKARKARHATRRLMMRSDACQRGEIGFDELSSSIRSWVNHVRYGDTWGLRRHIFRQLAERRYRKKAVEQ